MQDMKQQYKQAQVDAQAAGAVVVENVMSCCRGCVDIEIPDGQPHAWSFAGQGNELIWQGQQPMFAPEVDEDDEVDDEDGGGWSTDESPTPADGVYWYHGNGGGAKIAEAFKARGFEVDWDGTVAKAVYVRFPA